MNSEFEFCTESNATQFMQEAEQQHGFEPTVHRDGEIFCVVVRNTSKEDDTLLASIADRCDKPEVLQA